MTKPRVTRPKKSRKPEPGPEVEQHAFCSHCGHDLGPYPDGLVGADILEGFHCGNDHCVLEEPETPGFHVVDIAWSYGPDAPKDQAAYNAAEAAALRDAWEAARQCGQVTVTRREPSP